MYTAVKRIENGEQMSFNIESVEVCMICVYMCVCVRACVYALIKQTFHPPYKNMYAQFLLTFPSAKA